MHYKTKDVKREILLSLLKGEKSTGELARELGYVDEKGIPKYKNVEKQLNSLRKEGLIGGKKKRGRVGAPKTYWRITNIFKLPGRLPAEKVVPTKVYRQFIPQLIDYHKRRRKDEGLPPLTNQEEAMLVLGLTCSPTVLGLILNPNSYDHFTSQARFYKRYNKLVAKQLAVSVSKKTCSMYNRLAQRQIRFNMRQKSAIEKALATDFEKAYCQILDQVFTPTAELFKNAIMLDIAQGRISEPEKVIQQMSEIVGLEDAVSKAIDEMASGFIERHRKKLNEEDIQLVDDIQL